MNQDWQSALDLASKLRMSSEIGPELMDVLGALSKREEDLKKWLADHAEEIEPQAHLDKNSKEQVYWRYGYMIALRDALNLFQNRIVNRTPCSAGTSN